MNGEIAPDCLQSVYDRLLRKAMVSLLDAASRKDVFENAILATYFYISFRNLSSEQEAPRIFMKCTISAFKKLISETAYSECQLLSLGLALAIKPLLLYKILDYLNSTPTVTAHFTAPLPIFIAKLVLFSLYAEKEKFEQAEDSLSGLLNKLKLNFSSLNISIYRGFFDKWRNVNCRDRAMMHQELSEMIEFPMKLYMPDEIASFLPFIENPEAFVNGALQQIIKNKVEGQCVLSSLCSDFGDKVDTNHLSKIVAKQTFSLLINDYLDENPDAHNYSVLFGFGKLSPEANKHFSHLLAKYVKTIPLTLYDIQHEWYGDCLKSLLDSLSQGPHHFLVSLEEVEEAICHYWKLAIISANPNWKQLLFSKLRKAFVVYRYDLMVLQHLTVVFSRVDCNTKHKEEILDVLNTIKLECDETIP